MPPGPSLSRKTVNTRENVWNVYCFATNQMRDETAKGNHQTAAWSSHDLTRNNELPVCSSTNLHVYHYQMLNMLFFYFSLCISKYLACERRRISGCLLVLICLLFAGGLQILDTNDILRKSGVESSRQDQTQLDSASESNKKKAISSDTERLCLAASDPALTSEFRVFYLYLFIF